MILPIEPGAVYLDQLSCVFKSAGKSVLAVDSVTLDILPGEFFTLLGPSGSGKTTCLRMIGGFVLPTSGSVRLGGHDVTHLPPYERAVNTVFQDYALFPHMSILDNVAYALRIRGMEKAARERKAHELLELVRLPQVAGRKPNELSGGQRQRIALARALISEPKVLLLDEPLGALDLKLREQMQVELKNLQRELGITFIFVTHDQHEALSMSDRIGVFNQGRLEQVATPEELYNRPTTRFVADFVGTANVLEGEQARHLAGASLAMLRPEQIRVGGQQGAKASGTLRSVQYFGSFVRLRVAQMGQAEWIVDQPLPADHVPEVGKTIHLHWSSQAAHGITAGAYA
ncbi:MAG: ABC transporter ATP-binding protein [Burkholderiales bacterium]|nr:MAG: ABC transporter ATP-binding protein [Burkholderiales bacterium]